jgi:hypothetical protein
MNDADIDTMLFRDALEKCLHAFILFLIVLRAKSDVHIGPPYRHIFSGDRIETQMPSIRHFCQLQ